MTYMNMRIDKLNFILLFDKLFDQKPKNKRVMTFFGHVFCPLKLVAVHGFRLDLDLAFQWIKQNELKGNIKQKKKR